MFTRPEITPVNGPTQLSGRQLPATIVPMLVAHGRDDAIVLPAMAQELLERCPNATPSWYDGVGHAPFWEIPDEFNRLNREFLEAHR